MKDIKNIIIIVLALMLAVVGGYTLASNKVDDKIEAAKIESNNNQIVDEPIIQMPPLTKNGEYKKLEVEKPTKNIDYENIGLIEKDKLVKYFLNVQHKDRIIGLLFDDYKKLMDEGNEYEAVTRLNDIFAIQDIIHNEVEMLNYIECYDILDTLTLQVFLIQSMIDLHIDNDYASIEDIKTTFEGSQALFEIKVGDFIENMKKYEY